MRPPKVPMTALLIPRWFAASVLTRLVLVLENSASSKVLVDTLSMKPAETQKMNWNA